MKRFECSAILFDLDGVLVDSAAYVERQWRRWASDHGLAPEPFLRACHGRRALETIQLAAPHLDAEAEVRAFLQVEEAGSAAIGPLPGAAHLLSLLPAGSWAVVTSGTRTIATGRLRTAGLEIPAVMVCAEDVTLGKPSPDAYLLAAGRMGIVPADCLIVEDAPAGVQAARSAGIPVVGLTTTHTQAEILADACAESLTGVHLGRVDRDGQGRLRLEILIVEI